MRSFCLGSGSGGNSFFIESELGVKVLVDVGFSYSRIVSSLSERGIDVSTIDVILITHEHSDHVLGFKAFLKKHPNVKVFISKGTFESLDSKEKLLDFDINFVSHHSNFEIKDLKVFVLSRDHDCSEPVSYVFNDSNRKFGVFTDIGKVNSETKHILKTLDVVYFEANYCDDMLKEKRDKFHHTYVNRLTSNLGHLSLVQAISVINECCVNCERVILSHISQNTNSYENAYRRVLAELEGVSFELDVVTQNDVSDWH